MKKFLFVIFFSFFVGLQITSVAETKKQSGNQTSAEAEVFISVSPLANCYHAKKNCAALQRSRKIDILPISEAAKIRRPCKLCYPPTKEKQPKQRKHRPTVYDAASPLDDVNS